MAVTPVQIDMSLKGRLVFIPDRESEEEPEVQFELGKVSIPITATLQFR